MNKVTVLTKPNCPQCNSLKMYLKFALNNKYEGDLIFLDQVADQADFNVLASKHNILGLPAMIF